MSGLKHYMGGTRVRQEVDNLQYKNDYCERGHLIICRVGHVAFIKVPIINI